MSDLISRQEAIKIASGFCHPANIAKELAKLPSAQPEITQKDVELYCRQRCLSVITNELFNEMKARLAQPEIISTPSYTISTEEPVEYAPIVRCKDCKHRPTEDEDGEPDFPTNRCPCQCDDYYYSWMPKDDWFCAEAERREE